MPTPFPPSLIDTAYTWLCTRREDYHCHDDVWFLRFYWQQEREQLLHELAQESFCFSGVEKIDTASGSTRLWSARDALVLKALTLHLQEQLAPVLSDRVFHLAGTGEHKRGAKAAVREVYEHLAENVFVFRTDVKGYYASIHHAILLRLLGEQVRDPFLLRLLDDFLHHTVYCDGLYRSVGRGISLGCALSPLMGALYLKPLDDAMARTGLLPR